ncbi:DUF4304 domain-containing protein [Serpentinicella alkaliphila]|uniref:Uncharacterized protein DUF4304 n=1 Tax=Serpentinicella alkaliphila TaxID=1734049 RepID=A0A4R2TL95_9FIRM|nr:DUF4304 domain-containing protein [Serpentinicella alkaliphila]QUH26494.1 DUF4304 domain-containing protein [Serpentinicella alkaliphila]TCQ03222.1 uncharacterized protein DUF4304 [Serpentinicella alkaliphila]
MDTGYNEAEFKELISKYNYKEIMHHTFKNVITPQFKERGFRKNNKTFYKERDGLIEICNVQFSSFNHRTTSSLTYNISIAIPSLYKSLGITVKNKLEATVFESRYGTIILYLNGIPSNFDYWYRLEAYTPSNINEFESEIDENINLLSNQLDSRYNIKTGEGFEEVVVADIDNYILKFFESIPDAETLLDHIENDDPKGIIDESMMLQTSMLYYSNGEIEKGKKILNRIGNGNYKVLIERYTTDGIISL